MTASSFFTFSTPEALLAALFTGERAQTRQALAELPRRIKAHCRVPPVETASSQQLADFTQTYCQALLERPARRVLAAALQSWRGFGEDVRRVLERSRGVSLEDRPDPYYRHLLAKTEKVLREEPAFEERPGALRPGAPRSFALSALGVAEAQACGAPAGAGADPPLPSLRTHLTSSREDQLGEVVARPELRAQLLRILRGRGNQAATARELLARVLPTLSPAISRPGGGERLDDELGAQGSQDQPLQRLLAIELREFARELLGGLSPRTLQAARLRYAGGEGAEPTLAEVARALGVSPSTAENEVGDKRGRFAHHLKEFAAARGLDADDGGALLQHALEILRAGGI